MCTRPGASDADVCHVYHVYHVYQVHRKAWRDAECLSSADFGVVTRPNPRPKPGA